MVGASEPCAAGKSCVIATAVNKVSTVKQIIDGLNAPQLLTKFSPLFTIAPPSEYESLGWQQS